MYWQVTLPEHRESSPGPRWLPEKWTPEPRKQPEPEAAPTADARSVSLEIGYLAMTESILRMLTRYPDLPGKLASVIALQPGQSRQDHFNTLMEAVSQQGRYYEGLGLAIDEALQPFRKGGSWYQ